LQNARLASGHSWCGLFCLNFRQNSHKAAASKQSKEVQQDTKTMTANKTAKTSTDTVVGKIESYEAGKSIKVTVPGKIVSTKSFDLDGKTRR
jgi:hypothetical protein